MRVDVTRSSGGILDIDTRTTRPLPGGRPRDQLQRRLVDGHERGRRAGPVDRDRDRHRVPTDPRGARPDERSRTAGHGSRVTDDELAHAARRDGHRQRRHTGTDRAGYRDRNAGTHGDADEPAADGDVGRNRNTGVDGDDHRHAVHDGDGHCHCGPLRIADS
jgi:hypothetical protein